MSATCNLCGEKADDAPDMVHHLRVFHPDVYMEPARWPDGGLVIEDHTLGPDDFGGAA